jgi:hypothetical protein
LTDDEWIERFYSDFEKVYTSYKRPADYKERALKVLSGQRKPVKHQHEGITKKYEDM